MLNQPDPIYMTDATNPRGCTISILSPAEVRKYSSVCGSWQTLLNASDNPYAMYQSPLWWDHLLTTSDPGQLWLAVAEAGAGRIVGISPIQLGRFSLGFNIKSRSVLQFSFPVAIVLGGQPLLPRSTDAYDHFFDTLWRSFPQCSGVYLKCVSEESFCSEYIRSAGFHNKGILVYRPDDIRRFHGIKLPATFDEYLSKFNRKKRYNLKRQERLLREHGNGQLELVRIESPDQVAGLVAAAADIESHAWQQRSIGPRIADNATTRNRLTDLAGRGLLRSYLLRCGGVYCAYVLGYQACDVFHYSDIAFDDQFASFSPGTVLLYLLLADLIQHRRPREVNFGMGDSSYKEQFGNWCGQESSILLLRRSPVNRLRVAAHRIFNSVSRHAKSFLTRKSRLSHGQ